MNIQKRASTFVAEFRTMAHAVFVLVTNEIRKAWTVGRTKELSINVPGDVLFRRVIKLFTDVFAADRVRWIVNLSSHVRYIPRYFGLSSLCKKRLQQMMQFLFDQLYTTELTSRSSRYQCCRVHHFAGLFCVVCSKTNAVLTLQTYPLVIV